MGKYVALALVKPLESHSYNLIFLVMKTNHCKSKLFNKAIRPVCCVCMHLDQSHFFQVIIPIHLQGKRQKIAAKWFILTNKDL